MLLSYWRWRDQIWCYSFFKVFMKHNFKRNCWNSNRKIYNMKSTLLFFGISLTFGNFSLSNQLFSTIFIKLLVFIKKKEKRSLPFYLKCADKKISDNGEKPENSNIAGTFVIYVNYLRYVLHWSLFHKIT